MTIRFPVDDPIHHIDSTWQGWGGPFRYVVGVVAIVVALVVLFARASLGVPLTPFTAAFMVAVVVGLTKAITMLVNHDRKLRQVVATVWDEIGGPRRTAAAVRHTRIVYTNRRPWLPG